MPFNTAIGLDNKMGKWDVIKATLQRFSTESWYCFENLKCEDGLKNEFSNSTDNLKR